jgi:IclR family acetate operon transcriptional repressor
MSVPGKVDGPTTSTVERAIDILDAFTLRTPDLGLKDISEATGLHKATALRLLKTLTVRGLINRHPVTGRYALGFRLISMAEIARGQSGLVSQALPLMRATRDELNETVFLSVRVGDSRVDIEQVEGLQETRQIRPLGHEAALYAGASSKLFLAYTADDEIDAYLERTPLISQTSRTITDPETFKEEIQKIRRAGYSESFDESNSGGASVSAPIIDAAGEIIAAITITVPKSRFTPALRKQAIPALQNAAEKISTNLGGGARLRQKR